MWAEIAAEIRAIREREGRSIGAMEGPTPGRVSETRRSGGQREEGEGGEPGYQSVIKVKEEPWPPGNPPDPPPRAMGRENQERATEDVQTEGNYETTVRGNRPGNIRLPKRIIEAETDRDWRGKKLIHVGPGDGQRVIQELNEGAEQVQKVIVFQRRGPDPIARVYEYWTTRGAPPSGADYEQLMRATKGLPLPHADKLRLWAAVKEIRAVSEKSGDQHAWATRDAVDSLAGWSTPDRTTQESGRQEAEMKQPPTELTGLKREREKETALEVGRLEGEGDERARASKTSRANQRRAAGKIKSLQSQKNTETPARSTTNRGANPRRRSSIPPEGRRQNRGGPEPARSSVHQLRSEGHKLTNNHKKHRLEQPSHRLPPRQREYWPHKDGAKRVRRDYLGIEEENSLRAQREREKKLSGKGQGLPTDQPQGWDAKSRRTRGPKKKASDLGETEEDHHPGGHLEKASGPPTEGQNRPSGRPRGRSQWEEPVAPPTGWGRVERA